MELFKKLCEKIANVKKYKDEIKSLKKEISDRDTVLTRIKMVSTSNHYGYSKEDREYREKYCVNMKLKKIYELACEFDEEEIRDLWEELDEVGDME